MTVNLTAIRAHTDENTRLGTYTPNQFRDYWYNQGAELSRFALQQMRYGEIHAGDAVLVFVTEEMNPAIQIKADHSGPENIPVLKLNAVRKFMIPGTVYTRLTHREMRPQPAVAALDEVAEKSLEGSPLVRYEIKLPEAQRTLRIYFEKDFPYRIQKWDDSYRGLAGMGSKVRTTRAVRTHTIMDAYWRHHGNQDRALLKDLGLKPREMESH